MNPLLRRFDRLARSDRFVRKHAWAPWVRLIDPTFWAWFQATIGLPNDWTFRDCRVGWALDGLYPGATRVALSADGRADPDALTQAPDDWEISRKPIAGQPAIALPRLCHLARFRDEVVVNGVDYVLANGRVVWSWQGTANPGWIGRDPNPAAWSGAPFRLYSQPMTWLKAALTGRDNFDPFDPCAAPGGAAILDMEAFILSVGEDLTVDCGTDTALAERYARRRKAMLRPNRPRLPKVHIRAKPEAAA